MLEKTNLQKSLKIISKEVGEELLARSLDIDLSDLGVVLRSKDITPSLAMQISHVTNIEVGDLLGDNMINLPLMKANIFKQPFIESKFLKAAYSKKRIPFYILKIIEDYYGMNTRNRLLRKLGTNIEFLTSHKSEMVSTEFNASIYSYLVRYLGFNDYTLKLLGQSIVKSSKNEPFEMALKGLSKNEAYERFIQELAPKVEKSFEYRLHKSTNKGVVIRKFYRPEVQEEVKSKEYSNYEACCYSCGFGAMPFYMTTGRMPESKINRSIHLSGQYTEFQYIW